VPEEGLAMANGKMFEEWYGEKGEEI